MSDEVERSARPPRGFAIVMALVSIPLLVLFVGPLVAMLFGQAPPGAEAWRDAEMAKAIGLTFLAATVSTLLALVLGVPLAHSLARRRFPGRRLVAALVDLPLAIPHPVVGIALLAIFARRRLVGSFLEGELGLAVANAFPGVVLSMLYVSAPYLVQSARVGFSKLDPRLENTARNLGSGEAGVFFRVALPLALRDVVSGCVMSWARAISEFGSIMILAYSPKTATVVLWDRFNAYGWNAALPMALTLFGVCLAAFLVLQILTATLTRSYDPRT